MRISDWSSDVCSSDLVADEIGEILNLGLLVIMRQDHGIAVLAQPVVLVAQVETRKIFADGSSHGLFLSWSWIRACYTQCRSRSEERGVGNECVCTRRSRQTQLTQKKNSQHYAHRSPSFATSI